MRTILLFIFTTTFLSGYSQKDTSYFFGVNGKVLPDKIDAKKTISVEKINDSLFKMIHFNKIDEDWKMNNEQLVSVLEEGIFKIWSVNSYDEDTFFRQVKDTNNHYIVVDYFPDNSIRQYGISKYPFPLHKVGTWISNYKNGQKKSKETYIKNQMISNRSWDEAGNEEISDIFGDVEVMPKYGDGDFNDFRFAVQKLMRYPLEAAERNIQGSVSIEFVVMEDGRVEGIKIVKGVHPLLDQETYRLIKKMPSKWSPGYIDGKPVRVKFSFPLVYMLR